MIDFFEVERDRLACSRSTKYGSGVLESRWLFAFKFPWYQSGTPPGHWEDAVGKLIPWLCPTASSESGPALSYGWLSVSTRAHQITSTWEVGGFCNAVP